MATLLKSNQQNIDALKLKILEQKTILKISKDNQFLKNIIKTNQNTLKFLQNKN